MFLLGHTKQRCQSLLSIWKVSSPFLLGVTEEGKKNLAGGMNAGNHGSGKGIIYINPVALCIALF